MHTFFHCFSLGFLVLVNLFLCRATRTLFRPLFVPALGAKMKFFMAVFRGGARVEIFLGFACSQRDFWLYCRGRRPGRTPSIYPPWPFFLFCVHILKANRFIVFCVFSPFVDFFAWFYVARVTSADFVTCYNMLLISACRRPLYLLYFPFVFYLLWQKTTSLWVVTNMWTLMTAVVDF